MRKKRVLFVQGIPDNGKLRIHKVDQNGTISYIDTGSNLKKHLNNDLFEIVSIVLDANTKQAIPPVKFDAIFNEISNADANRISLKKIEYFCKSLPPHIAIFNRPIDVMKTKRDNIYNLLQGIDRLYVPKTVSIAPTSPNEIHTKIKREGFTYPVLFRAIEDHGPLNNILKVDDANEEFYQFNLDGSEYYLTQYVEYAQEGIYQKYRLIVIDGKVYLRHVKISDEWKIHHKNKIKHPEQYQQLGIKFFEDNKKTIQNIVTEIYQRLNLDYFGIDCFIDQEVNILVFEVNSHMWSFYNPEDDIFTNTMKGIKESIIKMIWNRI